MIAKNLYSNAHASVTDYSYDANNRMISISNGGYTKTYTYDTNGNMLSSSDGKTYTYDVQNRLISFANGTAQDASYYYYADGLRSSKTVNTGDYYEVCEFFWADSELIYEYESNSNYFPSLYYGTVYNYGLDLVSHYTTGEDSNSEYYYISDAHGDVKQLIDTSTLSAVSTNTYDAFGNGGAIEHSSFGYTGEYHDAETGFIYLRARYYDPVTGRFINEDPHWNLDNMVYGDEPEITAGNMQHEFDFSRKTYFLYNIDSFIQEYNQNENCVRKSCLDRANKQRAIYTPDKMAITQSTNLYLYANNNPVMFADANGETIHIVLSIIIFAGMGFIAGGLPGGGTPGNNQKQNSQVDSAVQQYNLSKEGRRLLHDTISHQNYSYSEVMEEASAIAQLGGKYVND